MNQVEHNDHTSLLGPLLKSINQIARFYETLPNTEDATKKMLAHLVSSWEPNMFFDPSQKSGHSPPLKRMLISQEKLTCPNALVQNLNSKL